MKAEALEPVWIGSVSGAQVKVMRGGEEGNEWLMVTVQPEGTPNSAVVHVNGRTAGFGHVNWERADQEVQEIAWLSMVDL